VNAMIYFTKQRNSYVQFGALVTLAILSGCLGGQGSTDGGSAADPNYQDGVFVAGDDTTGSMTLELETNTLSVGGTTGFFVRVVNSNSEPVPHMNVACDSEVGIAILEPQVGYELTNANGVMSGSIGCENAGSFQLVCRLTVGANRRKFASVRCTGSIPAGFQGFPGAAGGGLGGGAQTADDGDVSIVQAGFDDTNTVAAAVLAPASSIDINQIADCDPSTTAFNPEPFYDTYAVLRVQNTLPEQVSFESLQYTVSNVDGQGTDFTSKALGVTQNTGSSLASANGGVARIVVPIFKAYNGGKWVGDPQGVGLQITNQSLQTVRFTLRGQTSSGQGIELKARATASFGFFDRCR
jgi:hypothetical protein